MKCERPIEYFTKTQLKDRGWTDAAISRFLGLEDRRRKFYYGYGEAKLYSVARVEPAEAKPEFLAWRESKERRIKAQGAESKMVDLLPAIFGVNRTAKRFRGAAQVNYQKRKHGLAGVERVKKEHLYHLKDKGILAAVGAGRLTAVGTHGPLTIYRGEEYCFHSLLRPKGIQLPELGGGPLYVEQNPHTAGEPRLKDAIFTLESLPAQDASGYEKNSFPPRPPTSSIRVRDYDEDEEYDEDELGEFDE
jgi:hypothetical protein